MSHTPRPPHSIRHPPPCSPQPSHPACIPSDVVLTPSRHARAHVPQAPPPYVPSNAPYVPSGRYIPSPHFPRRCSTPVILPPTPSSLVGLCGTTSVTGVFKPSCFGFLSDFSSFSTAFSVASESHHHLHALVTAMAAAPFSPESTTQSIRTVQTIARICARAVQDSALSMLMAPHQSPSSFSFITLNSHRFLLFSLSSLHPDYCPELYQFLRVYKAAYLDVYDETGERRHPLLSANELFVSFPRSSPFSLPTSRSLLRLFMLLTPGFTCCRLSECHTFSCFILPSSFKAANIHSPHLQFILSVPFSLLLQPTSSSLNFIFESSHSWHVPRLHSRFSSVLFHPVYSLIVVSFPPSLSSHAPTSLNHSSSRSLCFCRGSFHPTILVFSFHPTSFNPSRPLSTLPLTHFVPQVFHLHFLSVPLLCSSVFLCSPS